MAEAAPPTEEVPIFNPIYWKVNRGEDIDVAYLDANYLKFPFSQAAPEIFTVGFSTDNDIIFSSATGGNRELQNVENINFTQTASGGAGRIKFPDGTLQTTAFTAGGAGNPVGAIITFAGSSAPAGYAVCNGNSRTVAGDPDLFAVIGYTFGGGGATFQLPNMIDKFVMGGATASGTVAGNNSPFINDTNITPFNPTQAAVQGGNTSVAFNTVAGITNWSYLKGEATGEGALDKYIPFCDDDNANGTDLALALQVGTGAVAFDNRPSHYVMIFCIKL